MGVGGLYDWGGGGRLLLLLPLLLLLLHRASWRLHVSGRGGGPRRIGAGIPVVGWLWCLNVACGAHHLVAYTRLLRRMGGRVV